MKKFIAILVLVAAASAIGQGRLGTKSQLSALGGVAKADSIANTSGSYWSHYSGIQDSTAIATKAPAANPIFTTAITLSSAIWKGVQAATYNAAANEMWISLNIGATADTLFYSTDGDSATYWIGAQRSKRH